MLEKQNTENSNFKMRFTKHPFKINENTKMKEFQVVSESTALHCVIKGFGWEYCTLKDEGKVEI